MAARSGAQLGHDTDYHRTMLVLSALGVGLVHTLDVPLVAEAVEAGRWLPQEVLAEELPDRYGFVMSPQGQWGARETPGSPRMVDTKQS